MSDVIVPVPPLRFSVFEVCFIIFLFCLLTFFVCQLFSLKTFLSVDLVEKISVIDDNLVYTNNLFNRLELDYKNLVNSVNHLKLYGGVDLSSFDLENSVLQGVYFPSKDYYCVWSADRLFVDVEKTDRHEYCHFLVDQDFSHFCGGGV